MTETQDRLFDVAPLPEAERGEVLSYTRRLTIRRRRAIAAGKHPLRLVPLTDVEGATCGNCLHVRHVWHGRRAYYKCGLYAEDVTHGPATDLRVKWPGCIAWAPVPDDATLSS